MGLHEGFTLGSDFLVGLVVKFGFKWLIRCLLATDILYFKVCGRYHMYQRLV